LVSIVDVMNNLDIDARNDSSHLRVIEVGIVVILMKVLLRKMQTATVVVCHDNISTAVLTSLLKKEGPATI